jgi:hypothetical protein
MDDHRRGEVHCIACGRCIADIELRADGRLYLNPPAGAGRDMAVRVAGGRLHCARCGGRAFVEWDLLSGLGSESLLQAA